MRTLIALAFVTVGVFGSVTGTWAQDAAGAKDHPIISRYPGAVIDRYAEEAFDEYTLLTGKVKGKTAESSIDLEGRVTKIRYWIPAGRSSLEVMRNYEEALTGSGFELLFTCKNKKCGGRDFNFLAVPYTPEQGDAYKDQRYLAARLTRGEGDVYVSLYINRAYGIGGAAKDRIYVQQTVVEVQPMEQGLVTVDAAAIRDGLDQEGHIAIYGILFETDSADIGASSRPALDEIASLLNTDPTLDLLVVGHTDDRGSLKYNRELSRRRAQAVVKFLEIEYGIAPSRLEGHGVGYLAPVASNESEAGRALNRRVELVRRRRK
jgi:OmpA-OmpF porin, OOP family